MRQVGVGHKHCLGASAKQHSVATHAPHRVHCPAVVAQIKHHNDSLSLNRLTELKFADRSADNQHIRSAVPGIQSRGRPLGNGLGYDSGFSTGHGKRLRTEKQRQPKQKPQRRRAKGRNLSQTRQPVIAIVVAVRRYDAPHEVKGKRRMNPESATACPPARSPEHSPKPPVFQSRRSVCHRSVSFFGESSLWPRQPQSADRCR